MCSLGALEWEKTNLVWDFGLISACDRGVVADPRQYFKEEERFNPALYDKAQRGDILFVQCRHLHLFYRQVVPRLPGPVVVVISGGDETFPTDCHKSLKMGELLECDKIGHIFALNSVYIGEKVTQIPIGIDYHTIAYKGERGGWGERGNALEQERHLMRSFKRSRPTHQRKLGAFVDFQHSDTMHAGFKRYLEHGEDRRGIFKVLQSSGVIEWGGFMRRFKLWNKKAQYAFSISPHGNGLDCHRTWEDLALGCIVIVKRSALDPLYEGLPVVIVDDWREVTRENMQRWLDQFGDVKGNDEYRRRISHNYWMNKILREAEKLK